jgi:hypothetical protein
MTGLSAVLDYSTWINAWEGNITFSISSYQQHLNTVSDVRRSFEFSSELEISALISIEGERIPMDRPVDTKGEANGVER